MKTFLKYAGAISVAGLIALAASTPSEARNGRNAAAIGGFVAGAAVGAAVANSNNYNYGPGYAYEPGYAYDPGPAYYDDSYAYAPAPRYYQSYGGADNRGSSSSIADRNR